MTLRDAWPQGATRREHRLTDLAVQLGLILIALTPDFQGLVVGQPACIQDRAQLICIVALLQPLQQRDKKRIGSMTAKATALLQHSSMRLGNRAAFDMERLDCG